MIIFLVVSVVTVQTSLCWQDLTTKTANLAREIGYPFEVYNVTTSDSYILEVHRIPYGINKTRATKGVAFLQHGILMASSTFMLLEHKSLAFMLANEGYDVWLGNNRGIANTEKHEYLSPTEDDAFWRFSFEEIGYYDLPAMIDFVLNATGEERLFYAAHSQGTTAFYVMCSMRPEYNKKITAAYHFSPVAFMSHLHSPLIRFVSTVFPLIEILVMLKIVPHRILPSNEVAHRLTAKLCQDKASTQYLCILLLRLVVGSNVDQLDTALLSKVANFIPVGTSVRQFQHFRQLIRSRANRFTRYNYGFLGNIFNYGRGTPPEYNLSRISCPITAYYSKYDWLSSEIDARIIESKIKSAKFIYLAHPPFNHYDWVAGTGAPALYRKVIKNMQTYLK